MDQADIKRSTLEALARPPLENDCERCAACWPSAPRTRAASSRTAASPTTTPGRRLGGPTYPGATACATRSRSGRRRADAVLLAPGDRDARGRGGLLSPARARGFRLAEGRGALSAAARVLRPGRWSSPPRSTAATSGTTSRSTPRGAPAAAARALPGVHAVREVARRARAARALADHRRGLAVGAGLGRPGVLPLQGLGRRAARLAPHRRRAGLDPAAVVAARLDGEGEEGQRRLRQGHQLRRDRARLSVGVRPGGGHSRADAARAGGRPTSTTAFAPTDRSTTCRCAGASRTAVTGCTTTWRCGCSPSCSGTGRARVGLDRSGFSPDFLVEGRGVRDAAAEPRLLLRARSADARRDARGPVGARQKPIAGYVRKPGVKYASSKLPTASSSPESRAGGDAP